MNNKDVIIHDYERKLQNSTRRLEENTKISKHNKELILGFKAQCLAENLSIGRTCRYVQNLTKLALWLNMDFDKATKKDFTKLVGTIEANGDYAPNTKQFYKVTIKKFFRWVKGVDRDNEPEEVKWIKTTIKKHEGKIPKNYPTEVQVKKLVDTTHSIRDKAFIMGLYESGCRVSEWGGLKIRDITFIRNGMKVVVSGKTGERKLLLVLTLPYLQSWLSIHPQADNPDAPVWVNMGTRNRGAAMTYDMIRIMIQKVGAEAGILKREIHNPGRGQYSTYSGKVNLNPHNFRHTRATVLANVLTEAQMNYYFGWEQGSNMPSVYVHLSGKEVDDTLLGYYGIKKKKDKRAQKEALIIKECSRCGKENKAYAAYCTECGLPLDVKRAVDLAEVEAEAGEIGAEIITSDKDMRETLLELKKEVEALRKES